MNSSEYERKTKTHNNNCEIKSIIILKCRICQNAKRTQKVVNTSRFNVLSDLTETLIYMNLPTEGGGLLAMRRKTLLVSLIILLAFSKMSGLCDQEEPRILLDEYHASCSPSHHLSGILSQLESKGYIVRPWGEEIDYFLLSNCDVLVLYIPSKPYDKEEKESIAQFVENGGNLIIFGEHLEFMEEKNIAGVINGISSDFGIEFNKDTVLDTERNREENDCHPIISDFTKHPVTKDVESIEYICGCSLKLESSAIPLAFGNPTTTAGEQKGKDVVVLAFAEYGKGRVLAVGDTDFLSGSDVSGNDVENFLSLMDNKKLGLNMFEWLASIKRLTMEADELASEGHTLFSQHEYPQAKSKFEAASENYRKVFDNQEVAEMQEMIDKCDAALNAEVAYQRGTDYYNTEDFESAKTEFETSKSLYDEVGDSENAGEAQSMIDLCDEAINARNVYETGIDHYNKEQYDEAITKFEEAIPLYEELGNTEKVSELENKIAETRKAIDRQASKNRMLVLIGILLVVVIVFLVVKVFLKQSEISEEMEAPTSTEQVYCPLCGRKNPEDASYCEYCKTLLKPTEEREKEETFWELSKKFMNGKISEEEYQRVVEELKRDS